MDQPLMRNYLHATFLGVEAPQRRSLACHPPAPRSLATAMEEMSNPYSAESVSGEQISAKRRELRLTGLGVYESGRYSLFKLDGIDNLLDLDKLLGLTGIDRSRALGRLYGLEHVARWRLAGL
jgi:hypothetical protein